PERKAEAAVFRPAVRHTVRHTGPAIRHRRVHGAPPSVAVIPRSVPPRFRPPIPSWQSCAIAVVPEPVMSVPLHPSSRRFDLDWLRIIAFGLLIFYHMGMYFVSWDWHVKSSHAGPALQPLML